MAFDTKKALESWKKAKPLLLTDTGISDFLRKLPTDAKSKTYLDEIEKAQSKVTTFMSNSKIKSEKKALACLQDISVGMKKYVDDVKEDRVHVLASMDNILKQSKKYLVDAIKAPTLPQLQDHWSGVVQLERASRLDPRGLQADPPLREVATDWFHAAGDLSEAHTALVKLMSDNARKPVPDLKVQMAKRIKSFADAREALEQIKKTADKI